MGHNFWNYSSLEIRMLDSPLSELQCGPSFRDYKMRPTVTDYNMSLSLGIRGHTLRNCCIWDPLLGIKKWGPPFKKICTRAQSSKTTMCGTWSPPIRSSNVWPTFRNHGKGSTYRNSMMEPTFLKIMALGAHNVWPTFRNYCTWAHL